MNERHFRQVLKNQAPRRPAKTLDEGALDAVLRSAAKTARRWTQVEQAWELAARPEWRGQALPVALRDGVLYVAVRDAATLYEIQRRCGTMLRDFRAGGVTRIQVIVSPRLELPAEFDVAAGTMPVAQQNGR